MMALWSFVLVLLGLSAAMVTWLLLRFTLGALAAMAGFNAVLFVTVLAVLQVA